MPDPSVNEGHFDQLLTNISVAWMQDAGNFMASKVFPTVPVAKASDKYNVYPKGAFLRDEVRVGLDVVGQHLRTRRDQAEQRVDQWHGGFCQGSDMRASRTGAARGCRWTGG